VDGGDNNQAFFADERGRTRIGYSVSLDAIREFQVNTSNFSAEYGHAAGGLVNAVTKSGTNELHGSVFYFIRDNALGAYNPFAVQTVLVNGANTQVHIKPEDRRQQFGGSVGGPLIKDRLFFFFSFDEQKRNFPATATPGNPAGFFAPLSSSEVSTLNSRGISAAQQSAGLAFLQSMTGVVPRTGDQTLFFPKFDWKITPNHTLTVNYNRLRWDSPGGILTSAVIARGIDSLGNDYVKEDWGIARLMSVLSPRITNELRFQYSRDFEFENSQAPVPGEPIGQTGFSPQIAIAGSGGLTFGKPSYLDRTAYPDERRAQVADTLSINRGRHMIKLGADVNRADDLLNNLFTGGGAYTYTSRGDFITDLANVGNPAATRRFNTFSQGFGPTAFEFATTDLGFFIQDDWHVRPRLTLNLGLRYEYEKIPSPQIPNPLLPASSVFPDDRRDIGPRVGFAWNITGKSRSVIRGGYALCYGRIINSTISNAITNTGAIQGQLQFLFRATDAGAPQYPNVLTAAPPPTVSAADVVVFAANTRLPQVHEFDLVFEQQIAANTALSVSYLGTLGRRLPSFLDRNLPAGAASSLTWTVVGGSFAGQTFVVPLYKGARPNTSFSRITTISDIVETRYSGLAVQLNRRMTAGTQVMASYQYARTSDNGQTSTTFTASNNVLDVNNLGLEQGKSSFDVRHRFSALVVWQPDYFKNSGRLRHALLDGYSVSTSLIASSSFPYTGIIAGSAPSGSGAISTGILGAGGSNRPPWIPRNAFQAPRHVNISLRFSRGFSIKEGRKIEIIGEAFNLFNHVNVTGVDAQLYTAGGTATAPTLTLNPTFGLPTSSSGTLLAERQIQLGMRFEF
jgi:hypothetical protein